METIEIVVYITIAIMAGALLVGFVATFDVGGVYSGMKQIFFGEDTPSYERISSDELAMKAYSVWQACGYGAQDMNVTVYVSEGDEINLSSIFSTFIKFNLCYSIQSKEENCGYREDVVVHAFNPPSLVRMFCDADEATLNITSVS